MIEDNLLRLARFDQDPTATAVRREPGRVARTALRVVDSFRGRLRLFAVIAALAVVGGVTVGYAAGELVLFPNGPLGTPVAMAPDDGRDDPGAAVSPGGAEPDSGDVPEPTSPAPRANQPTSPAAPSASASPSPTDPTPRAADPGTPGAPRVNGPSGPEPVAPGTEPGEPVAPEPEPGAPVQPVAPEPEPEPEPEAAWPTCTVGGVAYEHGDEGYSECMQPRLGPGEPRPQPCTLDGVTHKPGDPLYDECLIATQD